MKDDLGKIVPNFWKTMPRKDAVEAMQTGFLNKTQSARLWRMLDRQGEPPEKLEILVSKEDVDRMIESELRKRQK
jgi:hypothetical protein